MDKNLRAENCPEVFLYLQERYIFRLWENLHMASDAPVCEMWHVMCKMYYFTVLSSV